MGDKWTGEERLVDCSLWRIEKAEMEKTVRDYWLEGQGWKWDEFSQALPASWLIKPTGIVLDLTGGGQDKMEWLESSNRRFTVRSVYLTLKRDTRDVTWNGWRIIWKLRA